MPASCSHTLIGSVIGIGVANALMHGRDGTSGVDRGQAISIGHSLLLSPLVGFGCAGLLFLALRALVKRPEIDEAPKGNAPPPRAALSHYVRTKQLTSDVPPALAAVTGHIGDQVKTHATLAAVPTEAVTNVRNDMYLSSETIRLLEKDERAGLDEHCRERSTPVDGRHTELCNRGEPRVRTSLSRSTRFRQLRNSGRRRYAVDVAMVIAEGGTSGSRPSPWPLYEDRQANGRE